MKYGGSFIKGLSGGMSSGLSMIMELKWKKKANEELEKQKEEAKMAINELMADPANQDYLSSGIQTDPYSATGIQLTTSVLAWNTDMGKYLTDIQKAIHEGNHKEKDRLMEEFKIRVEAIKSLNLEGASVNEDFGFNISSPEGLKMINMQKTYKETPASVKPYGMTKEMAEVAGFKGMPETMDATPEAPKMSDYISAVNYLSKFKNASPETFNTIKTGYQKQFPNVDISNITQESLKGSPDMEAQVASENLTDTKEGDDQYYQEIKETPQPGLLQKGTNAVKKWLGMKGTPKVSTEGKEALIPTMTNEELYNALKGLDPSDPIYQSLYNEAVKRGLITK